VIYAVKTGDVLPADQERMRPDAMLVVHAIARYAPTDGQGD